MKKGFTLIELLAVIVILAILAIIATPVVLNIIDNSKEKSTIRGVENYLKSVDFARAQYLQKNPDFKPSICLIQGDGNVLCDEEHLLKVEVKGEFPSGGTIIFENNYISEIELIYDSSVMVYDEKKQIDFGEDFAKNSIYGVVYYDVLQGKVCSSSDYNIENSKTGYNGINNRTEKQNSCLKFYKLSETETTISLLLDHNTTSTVMWNSSGTFLNGPSEVLNQLKLDTDSWQGTLTPSNFYLSHSNGSYTIDYSNHKSRLLTAKEIADVTGNSSWIDGSGGYFYFDTHTRTKSDSCTIGNTTGCKYSWIYDRTSKVCKSSGCLNNSDSDTAGYWTASSFFPRNLNTAMHMEQCQGYVSYGVSYSGRLGVACVNNGEHYGVRPVIEISK